MIPLRTASLNSIIVYFQSWQLNQLYVMGTKQYRKTPYVRAGEVARLQEMVEKTGVVVFKKLQKTGGMTSGNIARRTNISVRVHMDERQRQGQEGMEDNCGWAITATIIRATLKPRLKDERCKLQGYACNLILPYRYSGIIILNKNASGAKSYDKQVFLM